MSACVAPILNYQAILSCAFLKNGDYCYCDEVVLGEKITARHNCYVGLLFDPLD